RSEGRNWNVCIRRDIVQGEFPTLLPRSVPAGGREVNVGERVQARAAPNLERGNAVVHTGKLVHLGVGLAVIDREGHALARVVCVAEDHHLVWPGLCGGAAFREAMPSSVAGAAII